jgi:excisionase family DNA binding protein
MSNNDRLTYTITEVAEALGVSEHHIRNLCQRGELPTLRLGRRILVPRRALQVMIEEKPAVGAGQ